LLSLPSKSAVPSAHLLKSRKDIEKGLFGRCAFPSGCGKLISLAK
jgi:hypothetical protein